MNPSTLIGLGVAALTLATAIAFSATGALAYVNLPGLGIVLGGTIAAIFIGYPLSEVRRIPRLLRMVLGSEKLDMQRDIDELSGLARQWASEDVHDVERALQKVANPFLRTGVQLVIDNTPEDQIAELLQWRMARMRAREQAEAQMFRTMASFAPAFGMLGTLFGLINLMAGLGTQDMDAIGQQMGIALIATFYGILLANLVFKPIAIKLERRTEQRLVLMNMVLQGISMMCDRRGPAMVRETLNSFMQHVEDEIQERPAKPAKGAKATPAKPAAKAAAAPDTPARPAAPVSANAAGGALPRAAAQRP
ncbi:MotA/TolQ/ExbB proton channel family protein [Orrella sp. JC864]|uniref:motility protein A n=1 Tax=Orrella sp. JC864 TaxID=3120298 RepID=UPI0030091B5F